MGSWCETFLFVVWEKIWKVVWHWAEKEFRECTQAAKCNWWCLCCNRWLCWIVVATILVLSLIVTLIIEFVLFVVCFIIVLVCIIFCAFVGIFGEDTQNCRDTCAGFKFTLDTSDETEDDSYSISGQVESDNTSMSNALTNRLEGVVMSGIPGNPKTNSQGQYSGTVNRGWSGTVTPILSGYIFKPSNRSYSDIKSDQNNQSYMATKPAQNFTVSGKVTSNGRGLADVVMTGLPGNPKTGFQGEYLVIVNKGWSGTVKPMLYGYTFDPAIRVYTNTTINQENQNYVASGSGPTTGPTTG